ncbi:class I SAM-dependent methyltransferase [Flaviaesturariibacter terrae]
METRRRPLQGVLNIIRFNWPFFAVALSAWIVLALAASWVQDWLKGLLLVLLAASIALTLVSLLVSLYIYDLSGFYRLQWLGAAGIGPGARVLNINAGFDETSAALQERFGPLALEVWDFYDPARHTEPSIARARAAYPAYPGTQVVETSQLPGGGSFDRILLTFAAHEIRNDDERARFFTALRERLAPGGRIIVTEHLRDSANALAYHFGVLHFLPRKSWLRVFGESGLRLEKETKFTPFVSTFVLHAAAT